MNGIELQDREFFAAIREHREPNASVAQVLPCYRTLHDLQQQLEAGDAIDREATTAYRYDPPPPARPGGAHPPPHHGRVGTSGAESKAHC